jgi:predicted homoserine dehydrogenase-like protein
VIIVDRALAERARSNNPVRIALFGAGFTGRAVALQLATGAEGMRLVALVNRTAGKAEQACTYAAGLSSRRVSSSPDFNKAIDAGLCAVTDDPALVWDSDRVDVVIEATGHVEYGTQIAFHAIRTGKHVVMMGAEIDGSVGPILKRYADRAGLIYTYTDGDEPGVGMNLLRFAASVGFTPVLMGQMKGILDHYRTPATQQGFADQHGQNPVVMSAFADGSKLALEAAIMGNATGFSPQVRGMRGYPCVHVQDMTSLLSEADFANGGLVEYSLGAAPHTGAFVICTAQHPEKRRLLSYLKMGSGPLYMFYTPYHLPPTQVQHSVARAALFHDATIAPAGRPTCDTVAHAKRDLKTGEVIDGVGGYACYGLVENYQICDQDQLLPIAIALDCRLKRDVAKDEPLTYADVELPPGRLCDRLRREQREAFAGEE